MRDELIEIDNILTKLSIKQFVIGKIIVFCHFDKRS